MVVNNCSLSSIVTNFINDKKSFITDGISIKELLQSFNNTLNCGSKQIVCLKDEEICDKTVYNFCEFYIKNLTREVTTTNLTVTPILSSSTNTPYTYKWTFDTTILQLVNGTNAESEILQLEWINNSIDSTTISLSVEDSTGCKDGITLLLDTCVPCDDKTFNITTITDNVCQPSNIVIIGGVEYFEYLLDIQVVCGLDTNYIDNIVGTRLEIVGVTTDYENGFLLTPSGYVFRIKKQDISYLTTKIFRFYVEIEDCSRFELLYSFQPNTIPCCAECASPIGDITVLSTCIESITRNTIEYYKTTIQVTLACGIDNLINYIQSLELVTDSNVNYLIEPVVGTNNKFDILIKKDDYELFCANSTPSPQGLVSLQGSPTYPIGSLINGKNYIQSYTSATLTDESYDVATDTYYFTVPSNTNLDLINALFCGDSTLGTNEWEFIDSNGLFKGFTINGCFKDNTRDNVLGSCIFSVSAFESSTGNNTMGDCVFGDYGFNNATSNNTMGDCTFGYNCLTGCTPPIKNVVNKVINSDIYFASIYTGVLEINNEIVSDSSTADLSQAFISGTNMILKVRTSLDPSILGYIEGDIAMAISNGVTVNYVL